MKSKKIVKSAKKKMKTPTNNDDVTSLSSVCFPDGKNKCPGEFCVIHSGECVRKTKSGLPYKNDATKKLGKDYYFDERFSIIGSKSDVEKFINDKMKESSTPKKSTKKGAKTLKSTPQPKEPKEPKKPKEIEKKSVAELNKIISELSIDKTTISRSGAVGKDGKKGIIKIDLITAIVDYYSAVHKKPSISVTKKKKELIESPKKEYKIKDIETMKISDILNNLKQFKEFEGMKDSEIKKIAGTKLDNLRKTLKHKIKAQRSPKKSVKVKKKSSKKIIPIKEKSPKKLIPIKEKSPKKIIPIKEKSPKKLIPIKEKSPKKIIPTKEKSPKKIIKKCGDFSLISKPLSEFELCKKSKEVCDTTTGKCVATDVLLGGDKIKSIIPVTGQKLMLDIDGNLFVGDEKTISKISKIKGIVRAAKFVKKFGDPQEYKKSVNQIISNIFEKGEKNELDIINSEIEKLKKIQTTRYPTKSRTITSEKLQRSKAAGKESNLEVVLKYPSERERIGALKDYLTTL